MFDELQLLDVLIGVSFIFLVVSLIAVSASELVSRLLALRSQNLEDAVKNLLDGEEPQGKLASEIYNHPLIKRLARKKKGWAIGGGAGLPSYIPSKTFALALFDILPKTKKNNADGLPKDANDAGEFPKDAGEVRSRVGELKDKNPDLMHALLPLLASAGDDINAARVNVEEWFDNAMERATGWYKRKMQIVIIIIAAVVVAALNVDTIDIFNNIWAEPTINQALVASATTLINENATAENIGTKVDKFQDKVESLGLIGWSEESWPNTSLEVFQKIAGLIASVIAVSLGAPFWFDLLNKLVSLRGSGGLSKPTTGANGGNNGESNRIELVLETSGVRAAETSTGKSPESTGSG